MAQDGSQRKLAEELERLGFVAVLLPKRHAIVAAAGNQLPVVRVIHRQSAGGVGVPCLGLLALGRFPPFNRAVFT